MDKRKFFRNIYYLIKRLWRATALFLSELFKPISFVKGEDFERFLRKKVFVPSNFDLVMKTHDYHENSKDYVEASLYPDYLFRNKEDGKEFWVEAKYRERLWDSKVQWCKPYQFKRYKQLSTLLPVYIAIGLGGRPRNPMELYIVPLSAIKYDSLFLSFLKEYRVDTKRKNILDHALDGIYNIKS